MATYQVSVLSGKSRVLITAEVRAESVNDARVKVLAQQANLGSSNTVIVTCSLKG